MKFGKMCFIWKGQKAVYGGDLGKAIALCRALGLSRVALKIGDAAGDHSHSYDDMEMAAASFRRAGIEVDVWHYVYGGAYKTLLGEKFDGQTPEQEALFARYWVERLNPGIYIIDAEKEYKYGWNSKSRVNQPASRAGRFMAALGDVKCKVALSSFRYPSLHTEFPFLTFIKTGHGCDMHMPQVYWGDYADAGAREFERSRKELKAVADLPIFPVGRAYLGDGHGNAKTIGAQLAGFGDAVKAAGCPGVTFWVMDHLAQYDPGDWAQAISMMDFGVDAPVVPVPQPEPEPEPVALTLEGLNTRMAGFEKRLEKLEAK